MIGTPGTSARHGGSGWAAFAAGAERAVRDHVANRDAESDAVVAQLNGTDADDVEHGRQSRLKRWQAER